MQKGKRGKSNLQVSAIGLGWFSKLVRNCLPIFFLVASVFLSESATGGEPDHSSAEKSEWRWQSDQPGFRPDLSYPISYTFALQGASIGFLGALDKDITGFTGPSTRNFQDAFTKGTRADNDEWYWNYLAHPMAGSEMYLRARAAGFNPAGSLLFAAAGSTIWEFGVESWYQRPSSQDLIVTPLAGAVLGEARFRVKRMLLEYDTRFSRSLAVAIDPLQSFSEIIGDAFGQDWKEPAFRKVPARANQSYPIFTTDVGSDKGKLSLGFQCRIDF